MTHTVFLGYIIVHNNNDKNPETIYENYKSIYKIEEMIDAL